MPKYRGSCGCYNREMAKEYGVIAAIVYNDIEDKFDYYEKEGELEDGYFYLSQTNRADALAIPRKSYGQALTKLEESGLLVKKIGYKPGTTTRATWVKLIRDDEGDSFSLGENDQSRLGENDQSIYNETKKPDSTAEMPVVVFLRVNPSGKKNGWKSQRVYSTQEEVDRLESMDPEETIDFKFWKSPRMVGDDTRAKFKRLKAKLVQPDVQDEDDTEDTEGEVNLWQ